MYNYIYTYTNGGPGLMSYHKTNTALEAIYLLLSGAGSQAETVRSDTGPAINIVRWPAATLDLSGATCGEETLF